MRVGAMTPKVGWTLAIDIGTTSTVVTTRVGSSRAEVVEVDGQRTIPSIVFVDDDGSLPVGTTAVQLAATRPDRAVRAPKRRLDDDGPIVVAGRALTAVELVAALLDHGAREALRRHGASPTVVRLTHPVAWSERARQRLEEAARRAGLFEPHLVAEPIAAAHSLIERPPVGGRVAIYDLGGETFDTVALEVVDGGFELASRALGSRSVGGELLDEMIMARVGERLAPEIFDQLVVSEEISWVRANVELRSACRAAKEAVSSHPYAEVAVTTPAGLISERLARTEIEELAAPLVEETMTLLGHVIDEANGVDVVHLVGGGSRMPVVAAMVRERWPGVSVGETGDPRVAVAVGAATLVVPTDALPTTDGFVATEGDVASILDAQTPSEGATRLDPGPVPFGSRYQQPEPLEEQPPAAEPASLGRGRIVMGAVLAVLALGLGTVLAMNMLSEGDTTTAPASQATTTQATATQPDEVSDTAEEQASELGSSIDESTDEVAEVVPADDDRRRFVVGQTLDGEEYVVTTTGTGTCPVGELAVRAAGVTEPRSTLTIVATDLEVVEGPQGSMLLVERCEGRFVSLRSGSQLAGSLDPATLSLIVLLPGPSELENLSFDFAAQRLFADAKFERLGGWTEIEIGLEDGSITEIGPSPPRPQLDVHPGGLTVTDSLTGEGDAIAFGTLRPFVVEQLSAVAPDGEAVVVPESCAATIDEVLSYDGIMLGFADDQLVGWYLDPDGALRIKTIDGIGVGSHLLDLNLLGLEPALADEDGRLLARFADEDGDPDFGIYIAQVSGPNNNDAIVHMFGGAACDELAFG